MGEGGTNPLVCIGINPSTAEPNNLDRTLTKVKTFSKKLGFDGWIMFNIYPQRATDPSELHECCDHYLHEENQKWIYKYLEMFPGCTIWAAWGISISKRPYLGNCLESIVNHSIANAHWITIGELTVNGHPHHPLYLAYESSVTEFDIKKYLLDVRNYDTLG